MQVAYTETLVSHHVGREARLAQLAKLIASLGQLDRAVPGGAQLAGAKTAFS